MRPAADAGQGAGRARAVVRAEDLEQWLGRVDPAGAGEPCAAVVLDQGEVVHYFLSHPRELPPHRGEPTVGLAVRSTGPVRDPGEVAERWRAVLPPGRAVTQLLQVSGGARGEDFREDLRISSWSLREGEWEPRTVVVVPGPDRVFARNQGILESGLLAGKEVAIAGLGSGGATIAVELAKAGVGRFVLIDQDRIEIENVGRHVCGIWDLGRRKTVAVRDRILEKNPYAVCRLLDGDLVEQEEELRSLLATSHVLVGATDNNRSRRLINRIALETGKPAIYGRAYVRACGGDVIRYRPGGPCYDCLFGGTAVEEEVSSVFSRQAPAYSDVEVRVEPGLSIDIAPIAQMCVRLVIQELVRGTDSSLVSLEEDLPGSLFLWANRREGQFADWKPMGFGFKDMAVQRWYSLRAERNPSCPACNEDSFLDALEAELRDASLSEP